MSFRNNHLEILKKQFIKSIADILILQTLKSNALHNNEIIDKLRSKFKVLNYNQVCPILSKLAKKGLITHKENLGRKKLYSLTEEGNLAKEGMLKQLSNLHIKVVNSSKF